MFPEDFFVFLSKKSYVVFCNTYVEICSKNRREAAIRGNKKSLTALWDRGLFSRRTKNNAFLNATIPQSVLPPFWCIWPCERCFCVLNNPAPVSCRSRDWPGNIRLNAGVCADERESAASHACRSPPLDSWPPTASSARARSDNMAKMNDPFAGIESVVFCPPAKQTPYSSPWKDVPFL